MLPLLFLTKLVVGYSSYSSFSFVMLRLFFLVAFSFLPLLGGMTKGVSFLFLDLVLGLEGVGSLPLLEALGSIFTKGAANGIEGAFLLDLYEPNDPLAICSSMALPFAIFSLVKPTFLRFSFTFFLIFCFLSSK
jgi:hypothetical protein